jgi:hypothetical protein
LNSYNDLPFDAAPRDLVPRAQHGSQQDDVLQAIMSSRTVAIHMPGEVTVDIDGVPDSVSPARTVQIGDFEEVAGTWEIDDSVDSTSGFPVLRLIN